MLSSDFYDQEAVLLAQSLIGKIMRVRHQLHWLSARIIETEAYELSEKASHASLGFTLKRKALFMPPGTLYMYYARGGDSLNISCRGEGNAVLIKSAFPHEDDFSSTEMIAVMQSLNPAANTSQPRPREKLCQGQTLLCRSLNLKVPDWDQRIFDASRFFIEDIGYFPKKIIQTTRLGIPPGRDAHLLYRFIDYDDRAHCTRNPLNQRAWQENKNYFIIDNQ